MVVPLTMVARRRPTLCPVRAISVRKSGRSTFGRFCERVSWIANTSSLAPGGALKETWRAPVPRRSTTNSRASRAARRSPTASRKSRFQPITSVARPSNRWVTWASAGVSGTNSDSLASTWLPAALTR